MAPVEVHLYETIVLNQLLNLWLTPWVVIGRPLKDNTTFAGFNHRGKLEKVGHKSAKLLAEVVHVLPILRILGETVLVQVLHG